MQRNWLITIVVLFLIFFALMYIRVFVYGPGIPYLPGYGNASTGTGTPAGPGTPMGPGMMYGSGYSTVGCPGMAAYAPGSLPISRSDALGNLQNFASRYGANVRIEDLLAFSNDYYADLVDAGSGLGLAEVLVDRYTGNTYLEPGPNMMWNVRYGGSGALGEQRYDLVAAQNISGVFLQSYLPGARVMRSKAFPGYYTFDFGRNEIEGMLSVNSYTGDIWVHTWHGFYISENGTNTTS